MVNISDISPTDLQVRSNIEQHNIMIGSINEVIEEVNAINPDTIKEDIVTLKNDVSDHETRIINNERANVEQDILIARNGADIVTNTASIDTLKTTTDYALVNVGFEGDGDGVTARESQINGGIKENVLPIADADISGIMNSSTFRSVSDAIRRIETLEGRQGTYFVVFPNDTPTQEEITIAYLMAYPSAPNPPIGGTGIRDIAKSKTFIYNGAEWVETSERELPVFGLGTEGLIKGSNTEGQVFAEPNGEGSVKGWSDVKTDIANLKTDVVTAQNTANDGITNSGTNATEIIGLKARVAVVENGKIDKNQGSENSGLTFKVGENGNVELVPFPEIEIDYDDVFERILYVPPSTPPSSSCNDQVTYLNSHRAFYQTVAINGKYYITCSQGLKTYTANRKYDVNVNVFNDSTTTLKNGAYYIYLNSIYDNSTVDMYISTIPQSHKIRCDVIDGKIKNIASRIVSVYSSGSSAYGVFISQAEKINE